MRTVLFDFVLHGFAEVDETLGEQPGADGADAEHVLALEVSANEEEYENEEENVIRVVHHVKEVGVQ